MLTVTIPEQELFDDATSKFIYIKEITLTLEHSLVSLSKWEQKWEKPFITNKEHSTEETLDYVRCMVVSPENPPEETFSYISPDILSQVVAYINAKMTATWFSEIPGQKKASSGEVMTAEIIYYWLIALQIPFEVQYWHLNRLITLIKVTNIKNDPKKKMMPKREAADMQRRLNEERKARFNTKG